MTEEIMPYDTGNETNTPNAVKSRRTILTIKIDT
jgi:hypothetical protein